MAKVKVIQPEEGEPIAKEVLADAIVRASAAMTKLAKSGLNRRAIVVLVVDKSQLYKYQVEKVLDALADFKKDYCA